MSDDALKNLGNALKEGLVQVGRKASASALKSIVKDGTKVIRAVDKRFVGALKKLDEMIDEPKPEEHRDDEP